MDRMSRTGIGRNERGIALLVTIIALLVASVLGFAFVYWLGSTSKQVVRGRIVTREYGMLRGATEKAIQHLKGGIRSPYDPTVSGHLLNNVTDWDYYQTTTFAFLMPDPTGTTAMVTVEVEDSTAPYQ